jgi:hypothetical protein
MFSEFPQGGKPCWVSSCTGYRLPPGLPERSRVTVMEWEGALGRCRDENGHDWTLCRTQIEPGIFLYLDGGRCDEPHPKFAEFFRHALAEGEAKLASGNYTYSEHKLQNDLSHWRWYLERNGYDAHEPPRGPRPKMTSGPSPRRF